MKHSDVYAGAVLLALSAGIYALTTGFDEVPAMLSQNVPPTFFPRFVVTIIVLLSLALIVGGLKRAPEETQAISPAVFTTAAVFATAAVNTAAAVYTAAAVNTAAVVNTAAANTVAAILLKSRV